MIILRNSAPYKRCLVSIRSYRPVVVSRVITSPISTSTSTSIEDPHTVPTIDPLDSHILASLRHILSLSLRLRDVSRPRHTPRITSLYDMYDQYRSNAHRILEDFVLVTEEHPRGDRRAVPGASSDPGSVDELPNPATVSEEGDGTVLVVHAMLKRRNKTNGGIEDLQIDKMSVCSGFVLNVRPSLVGIDNDSETEAIDQEEDGGAELERGEGAFVMTCAHTLEEVRLPAPSCSVLLPKPSMVSISIMKMLLIRTWLYDRCIDIFPIPTRNLLHLRPRNRVPVSRLNVRYQCLSSSHRLVFQSRWNPVYRVSLGQISPSS
jgi:hypothetical protein